MNVYQKDYHPEFIKELPVHFNKIKNMNLDFVPKEYHCLFTTDWNWGKHSTMEMSKRMTMHQLFLEYIHNDTKALISKDVVFL
jgi:hypothetical protein